MLYMYAEGRAPRQTGGEEKGFPRRIGGEERPGLGDKDMVI